MNLISSLVALLFSASPYAKQLPIQVSGGMTFSAFDNNMVETEALGYKTELGYHINENVLFELGYADFSAFSEPEIDAPQMVTIETDLMLPVSQFSSIYAGIGGAFSSDDTNLTAALGLTYQLSLNWYADFGYQGVFDLVRQQDDLYAFNALLVYRFSSNEVEEGLIDIKPRPNVDQPVEVPTTASTTEVQQVPVTPLKKAPTCQQHLLEYQVMPGDSLNQIARTFGISLEDILEENLSFNRRDINLIYPGEKVIYPKLVCLD